MYTCILVMQCLPCREYFVMYEIILVVLSKYLFLPTDAVVTKHFIKCHVKYLSYGLNIITSKI